MSGIDISKLPGKILGTLAVAGTVAVIAVAYMTSVSGPFMFNGQEFGITSKLKSDLEANQKQVAEMQEKLEQYKLALKQTEEVVVGLRKQVADAEAQRQQLWFPVADLTFSTDGNYRSSESSATFKGAWRHRDSEITLKLVSVNNDEVVFETNLQAPGNKVRISKRQPIWFSMEHFDYLVSVRDIALYDEERTVELRVERQQKVKRTASNG